LGHEEVRVGFVTTERTPALLEEAISNGALFILHKPFDDAELVAVVANAVRDLVGDAAGASHDAVTNSPESAPDLIRRTGGEPISHAAMQLLLMDCLGNIPFRLIPHEKMVLEKLTANNLLGLYAAQDVKGVYAIGIMDANAVCMVGGGAARMPPNDVRPLMASGLPNTVMMDKANEFLRAAAASLSESAAPPASDVTMAKVSVVKNTFAKLTTVLAQQGQRSDFRLAIPGYGEGRMAFFVMTS